ncbi:hypothetical protein FRC12_002952 [Ceratobasidium sp. 428]|nr:hypothetical protein FRC12_002952 [Ceratobasidium sp. 428]
MNAPIQPIYPHSDYQTDMPNVVDVPFFWVFVAGCTLLVTCAILAKFGLFTPHWPTTHVNIAPRTKHGTSVPERTGRLVFPIPLFSCVWYGQSDGIKVHCLYRLTITKYISGATLIPLSEFGYSCSRDFPPEYVVLAYPPPAYVQDVADHDRFCTSRVPLALEFSPLSTAFGPMITTEIEQEIDYRPRSPVDVPPSPEVTRYDEDVHIELSNLRHHSSTSSFFPSSIPPSIMEPAQPHIRDFINRNRFHASRLPLGLGIPTPTAAFGVTAPTGPVVEEVEVNYHPDIPIIIHQTPAPSIPFMILGPAYST